MTDIVTTDIVNCVTFAAVGVMKKGRDGFDVDAEYTRFRRRQSIHRMHLVGYAVSAALVLIGMLLFWH